MAGVLSRRNNTETGTPLWLVTAEAEIRVAE